MQILHIKPKQPAQETPSLPFDQQHSDHFVTVRKYSLDEPFSDTGTYLQPWQNAPLPNRPQVKKSITTTTRSIVDSLFCACHVCYILWFAFAYKCIFKCNKCKTSIFMKM